MLKQLFADQSRHISDFFNSIDIEKAQEILHLLVKCKGTVFFSGVGKSGIIAEKLAMTLVSTGTKAFYLSPTSALHGDIGIVSDQDLCIFISKSGETLELLALLPYVKQKGAFTLAWISRKESSLAKACHDFILLPVERELCPFDLAPTTSTAIQLIFGDVLAVALMRSKSFSLQDYAKNHPAGSIGKKIAYTVEEVMIRGDLLPVCYIDNVLKDVLAEFSEKKCGCIIVLDRLDDVRGVFTDGDLRRALQKDTQHLLEEKMENLMTKSFLSIEKHHLLQEAALVMQSHVNKWVTTLPVLQGQKLVGLIRMHDVMHIQQ